MRLATRLGVVVTVAVAVVATTAQAAFAVLPGKVYISGGVLYFWDTPGVSNVSLTVRTVGASILFDAQHELTPSSGCWWPDADHTRVACSGSVSRLDLHGREGDDVIDVDLASPFDMLVDYLYGEEGDDILRGGRWGTALRGGDGDDVMYGRSGDDGFVTADGPDGSDQMYGGSGDDSVEYMAMSVGVHASADGISGDDGAPGEGDTIGADVEHFYGTRYDDVLIGNSSNNRIRACGGADVIYGLGGDDDLDEGDGIACGMSNPIGPDIIVGGAGVDTFRLGKRTAGVNIDLDNAFGDDGEPGEGDSVIDIENIVSTVHNDVLTGNAVANTFYASEGNDIVFGQGGDDRIYGQWGNDSLFGGAGADHIDGGEGDDLCNLGRDGLVTVFCES